MNNLEAKVFLKGIEIAISVQQTVPFFHTEGCNQTIGLQMGRLLPEASVFPQGAKIKGKGSGACRRQAPDTGLSQEWDRSATGWP